MSLVIENIFNQAWAISPAALEAIISIADREHEYITQAIRAPEASIAKLFHRFAVEQGGSPLYQGARTFVRDGIAIMPVYSAIFPRANMMTDMSGATSLEMLAKEFTAALNNPNIRGIMMNFDSPGGAVVGVSEFANLVYKSRNIKPIQAFAYGMCASAAYWIASATSKIIAASTSELGSVGVVAAFKDTSAADAKTGVKTIEVVSSISPLKRVGPGTDEGRAKVQRIVDSLAEVFVSDLAQYRGTSAQNVLENFGKGDVFVGGTAVSSGMADEIGTFENALQDMVALCSPGNKPTIKRKEVSMSDLNVEGSAEITMTAEALAENHPETYQAVLAKGIAEGATQERARVQAIEAIKVPGFEAFISERKWTPEATASSVALAILQKQEETRNATAAAHAADAQALAGQTEGLNNPPAPSSEEEQKTEVTQTAKDIAAGANRK